MGHKLVVVESPAKAKTIGKYLGKGYKVQASLGHFRDLPKSDLGVDVNGDFEPTYVITNKKAKNNLKRQYKYADEVYIASDPDREGEAIGWHIKEMLGLKKGEYERVTFNEITKSGVKKGINNPRKLNMDRVNSQQARRILDRLVGYKLSPMLWKFIRKGLSAGRVQSVALKLIVDLERKIENFNPKKYWTIKGEFANKFMMKLNKMEGQEVNKSRLLQEKRVDKLKEDLKDRPKFEIDSLDTKSKKKYPYPPFTTSTLQQTASKSLNFSSKKTMKVAQSLYEGKKVDGDDVGLITYMRTDSVRVSDEAKKQAQNYIKEAFGDRYTYNYNRKVSDNAQDGHEAIRPTSIHRKPKDIKKHLNKPEYRLYKLIWNSFLNSQLAPMEYNQLEILAQHKDYEFRGLVNKMMFEGFFVNTNKNNDNYKSDLPSLNEGEMLDLTKLDIKDKWTKPPKRYTESKMVKDLEKKNIGRPSTFSNIISTLKKRNYVKVKKSKFHPTELGFTVTDFLVKHFPNLISVEFTSSMEDGLDKVSQSELDWKNYLKNFWDNFYPELKTLEEKQVDKKQMQKTQITTDLKCSKCGGIMVLKEGKNGKFLACGNYPNCKNTKGIPKGIRITKNQIKDNNLEIKDRIDKKSKENKKKKKEKVETDVTCSNGNKMVVREGKKGKFLGCGAYPKCKCGDTVNIPEGFKLPKGKKIEIKEELDDFKKDGGKYGKCPECGGLVRKVKGGKGEFLGCSNFPDCKYTAQLD